jgi:cell division protein FtsB
VAARTVSGVPARGLGRSHAVARLGGSAPAGGGLALAGVRWDRLGRLALLFLLIALLYLYLSAGIHMFSKWSQDRRTSAAVVALKHEHALLVAQHEMLARQATLEAEARQLGMIKPGEQPFIATGLPDN